VHLKLHGAARIINITHVLSKFCGLNILDVFKHRVQALILIVDDTYFQDDANFSNESCKHERTERSKGIKEGCSTSLTRVISSLEIKKTLSVWSPSTSYHNAFALT